MRRVLLQTAEGLALRVCVCAGSFVRRWRLVGTPRRIFTDSVVARTGRGRGRARGLETGARSEGLSQLAQHFKAQATKAKRFQMWQHSKFGAVVGGAASPLAWRSLLSPPYSTIICACWCACRLYMRHTQHARTSRAPHTIPHDSRLFDHRSHTVCTLHPTLDEAKKGKHGVRAAVMRKSSQASPGPGPRPFQQHLQWLSKLARRPS